MTFVISSPCLHLIRKFARPPPPPSHPSESFQNFKRFPLLGSQLRMIPSFFSLKNQVIPPKILRLAPQAINNDRSLISSRQKFV